MNPKPVSFVGVELTNHCNYRCRFCPQSQWEPNRRSASVFSRPRGFMEFDLFRGLIDEAGEISDEVNFSFFGEPMLHPEFFKFMDYLKHRKPGLSVVMNTNLSHATAEIFQKLIEIEMDELRLSIDAATSETYDIVRPGSPCLDLDGKPTNENRFDTICRKAEFWLSLPDHRPTRHVFTVNSINLPELEMFVRRWLPMLGKDDTILCKNVITYGGKISDKLIFHNPCNVWELNILNVDWSGRVSPCNLDTNMDLAIGSFPEKSLLEIHRSEERLKMERAAKAKDPACCKECIDGNNWSRNIYFRSGDRWSQEHYGVYCSDDR